jgi:phosphoribosylformylglycinamidine synthase subunit PurL
VAGNPRYGRIDPRYAAEHAVIEAVRRVVAVGAQPIGLTDCLNFGNPRKVEHYSELTTAIDGLARAASAFSAPFVSGNVSLYNESANGRAIPASPIVACVGALADVARVVTMPLKAAGSVLYLIGQPQMALGGSVLLEVLGRSDEHLPRIDYDAVLAQHALMERAAKARLLRAANAIRSGGLAVAVCEMTFAAMQNGRATIGAQIDDSWQWAQGNAGALEAYFGEAGGFVVEIAADDVDAFEALVKGASFVREIGVTVGKPLISIGDETFDVQRLREIWQAPLEEIYP